MRHVALEAKSVVGLWIEQAVGAKFWLKVINELKARGVNDILIAVVDGLMDVNRLPACGNALSALNRVQSDNTCWLHREPVVGMRRRVERKGAETRCLVSYRSAWLRALTMLQALQRRPIARTFASKPAQQPINPRVRAVVPRTCSRKSSKTRLTDRRAFIRASGWRLVLLTFLHHSIGSLVGHPRGFAWDVTACAYLRGIPAS
jgi:Transposase, Mutator family